MCNIVTIASSKYVVDVGYGAESAFQPVPLQDGYEFTIFSPRRGKLEYRSIDHHSDPSQRLWVYSMQEDAQSEWKEQYAFVETEFFQKDYEMTNYFCSTSPDSFFSRTVLAMRAIVEDGRVVGIMTLFKNEVRRKIGATREVIETLKTEDDRVRAVEKYFFIPLTPEDREGIKNTGLALGQE
jgi:arylamine N-acetyltransferase